MRENKSQTRPSKIVVKATEAKDPEQLSSDLERILLQKTSGLKVTTDQDKEMDAELQKFLLQLADPKVKEEMRKKAEADKARLNRYLDLLGGDTEAFKDYDGAQDDRPPVNEL